MATKDFANLPTGFGWAQGEYALQPHVQVPDGTYEEEHARQGFFGRTSHLYHRKPPTGWLRIEGPLKHHAYHATRREGLEHAQPEPLLWNHDARIGIAKLTGEMKIFARNADGDEVRFIHTGSGILETDYGDLEFRTGDYLVIPRGTTYRFVAKGACTAGGGVADGNRFAGSWNAGTARAVDPMVMRVPVLPERTQTGANPQVSLAEIEARINDEGFYPWNPMNVSDGRATGSLGTQCGGHSPDYFAAIHLPPVYDVHCQNFVVVHFAEALESEPGAMKVPFYHRNIDFDEVLFYHEGNFFSREGIAAGSVTFHPQGIHHGPHPNAEKNAEALAETKEIAVMVDTLRPLRPTAAAGKVEWSEYHLSWRADQKR